MAVEDAVDKTIAEVPDSFVLKQFLLEHKAEVKGMILTEYNEEEVMNGFKEEAYIVGNCRTPLLNMLADGIEAATLEHTKAAEMLISAQKMDGGIPDDQWLRAQRYVLSMGQQVARHNSHFADEACSAYDDAMARYYTLFNVEPVPIIAIHDGQSPIHLDESLSYKEQFGVLWNYFVPLSGVCQTLQGEVIRIAGRIEDEINRNGGANWDAQYKKMLTALQSYLLQGNPLHPDKIRILQNAVDEINACQCNCGIAPDILIECALAWVRRNPIPMSPGKVDYRR